MKDIITFIGHDLSTYIIENRPLLLVLFAVLTVLVCLLVGKLSAWVHGGEQSC